VYNNSSSTAQLPNYICVGFIYVQLQLPAPRAQTNKNLKRLA